MSRRNGTSSEAQRTRRPTGDIYLSTIAETCPPDTWREIVEATVEHAKQGDRAAREWLASYLVGKPQTPATTLHAIAVEEESGTDKVARDAEMERLFG